MSWFETLETRMCRGCDTPHPVWRFYPGSSKCVPCVKERVRDWIKSNPARAKLHRQLYRKRHPEAERAKCKRYWASHRDQIIKRKRRFYRQNRERLIREVGEWRRANPEKRKAQRARWKARHPDVQRRLNQASEHRLAANLTDRYIAKLLRQQGRKQSIAQHRKAIQLWRTKHLFQRLAAGSVLSRLAST